jgi:hypothetical protein
MYRQWSVSNSKPSTRSNHIALLPARPKLSNLEVVEGNILEEEPYASRPERESHSKGTRGDRRQGKNVVHVCTTQLSTQCPIAHSTHSSPPAPRDRLLTHVVTCANRVDGEEKKPVDVKQSSSWKDKIVREIGCH